jgi:hypothetical protein
MKDRLEKGGLFYFHDYSSSPIGKVRVHQHFFKKTGEPIIFVSDVLL